MDSLQASPAAPASLKASQQLQPACTHFSLIYISHTHTVSHLGPVPQGGIPSRGCCSCLAVLCHQRAPSLQALRVLNLWEGICSSGYTTCPRRAHFWHLLNVISMKSQRVGTVVKASTGSELGGQPCSITAAHSSWWDTPAFSAACKKFSLFPDTTGNSEMEQAALFIPKQIPGTCLPINSQRRPGGSRDSGAGRREIRDCPLALFKKVPFTAFPSANLRAPAH